MSTKRSLIEGIWATGASRRRTEIGTGSLESFTCSIAWWGWTRVKFSASTLFSCCFRSNVDNYNVQNANALIFSASLSLLSMCWGPSSSTSSSLRWPSWKNTRTTSLRLMTLSQTKTLRRLGTNTSKTTITSRATTLNVVNRCLSMR